MHSVGKNTGAFNFKSDVTFNYHSTLKRDNHDHTTTCTNLFWLMCYVFLVLCPVIFVYRIYLIHVIFYFVMRGLNFILLIFCGVRYVTVHKDLKFRYTGIYVNLLSNKTFILEFHRLLFSVRDFDFVYVNSKLLYE
jgi:hypothetical protein